MNEPDTYEKSLLTLERIAEENGRMKSPLLTDPVCLYLGRKSAGVLDVADLYGMDAQDFFVSAWMSVFEELPPAETLERWRPKMRELDRDAFRTEVMESLRSLPDIRRRGIRIENNIYLRGDAVAATKGLKARILSAGYGIARKLPLSWKIRLKKVAMRFLIR